MFYRRRDGKRVKDLEGVAKLMPLFLPSREGSVNKYLFSDTTKYFDDFIKQKQETDKITYTYRDIVVAIMVRVLKCLPRLNRFIVAKRFYQRNSIDISMMVHKSFKGDTPEVVAKASFSGDETIKEVKEIFDNAIEAAIKTSTESDKTAKSLARMPMLLLRLSVRMLRIFDHFGWLSKRFLFKVSPFHSSIFFTDLKSIGLEYIFHHLYNFGNCPFFVALGKEQVMPVVNGEGELAVDKVFQMGLTIDDRCIDGLYLAFTLKLMKKLIRNLSVLERPPLESEIRD